VEPYRVSWRSRGPCRRHRTTCIGLIGSWLPSRARNSQRLLPSLEVVNLARGDMMIEPDQPIRFVWFPHFGVVSVVTPLEDGTEVEAATIGREGVVGCELLTGGDSGISRTFVQVSGEASRIELAQMPRIQREIRSLTDLLDRYARALFKQVMQSVACNGQLGLSRMLRPMPR
jgi:hypothetical protein